MTISNLPFRQLPLFYLWSMVSPWAGCTKTHGWMCDPYMLQNMEPLASEFAQEGTSVDAGSVHVYPKAFVELLGRGTPCLLQKGQQYVFIGNPARSRAGRKGIREKQKWVQLQV